MFAKLGVPILFTCLMCWSLPTGLFAQNLLKNGNFDQVSRHGHESIFTRTTNQVGGGPSGAEHWTTWAAKIGATVETEWIPSDFPAPGSKKLWVRAVDGGGGIVQVFAPEHEGPEHATACVWIYVEQGEAFVGIGDGGNTHASMFLKETNQWELITVGNGVSPANELIIYGHGDWYVASAAVFPGRARDQEFCCSPGNLAELE